MNNYVNDLRIKSQTNDVTIDLHVKSAPRKESHLLPHLSDTQSPGRAHIPSGDAAGGSSSSSTFSEGIAAARDADGLPGGGPRVMGADTVKEEAGAAFAEVGGALAALAALAAMLARYRVPLPAVTIEYRDLSLHTDALVGAAGLPTVGNSFMSVVKRLLCIPNATLDHPILAAGLSGVLRPGRPTLLLGPSGSGKSSLLRLLAGRYRKGDSGNLRVGGELLYNGHTLEEFVVERTAAYVDQHDNHTATLTVMETLEFAQTCQLGSNGGAYDLPGELRRAMAKAMAQDGQQDANGSTSGDGAKAAEAPGTKAMSDEALLALLEESCGGGGAWVLGVMRALGITHTANTPVGDAMLRGVSGGERTRVTTAEMLVGPRRVLFLDEISTGLDSATLFTIADLLCEACRGLGLTMVVCLLQPPPEVYYLFDDVMIMSAGHVTFHGPVAQAVPFCESLGFVRPPRKDVPSFLQEVATASGQQELAGPKLCPKSTTQTQLQQQTAEEWHVEGLGEKASGGVAVCGACGRGASSGGDSGGGDSGGGDSGSGSAGGSGGSGSSSWVVSPAAVVAAYWESGTGRDMRGLLDRPFQKDDSHPAALARTRFALRPLEALSVVAARQALLVLRDHALIKGRLVQFLVMGAVTGALFLQLGHSLADSRTFFGVAFLAVMFIAMGALPAIPVTIAAKSIWLKHRASAFYPAWCYAAGSIVAQLPVIAADTALYCVVLYFMVGFYVAAGHFFLFYLTLFSFGVFCNVLYRLIAYLSPNTVAANAFGGFCMSILILLSGFPILRKSIPGCWIWAYYVSPFAWALRCLVINEFTSPAWSDPAASDTGQTIGEVALGTFDFYTSRAWFSGGIGYLWGLSLLLLAASSVALAYVKGDTPIACVADPKQLAAARRKASAATAAAATALRPPSAAFGAIVVANAATGGDAAFGGSASSGAVASGGGDGGGDGGGGEVVLTLNPGRLPYTPIRLVFQDLRYFVPNPSKGAGKKAAEAGESEHVQLLGGVTGWALPGSLTALMGATGAGKTTLMDVLAGRKTVGRIAGSITVNGHPKMKKQSSWARCAGYVEQMDIHTPTATVREALYFSARLRLPGGLSRRALRTFVDEVISMVELEDVQYCLVGLPGAEGGVGLSLGARKRLTLALELVANPSAVFVDEPTSGLDARAASVVMRAVRAVASDGRTVVVTVHQPSVEIFEAFDMLLLLQHGGRTTYFGPMGRHSASLIEYLRGAAQGVPPLPEGYNPATWMLEVTGAARGLRAAAVEGADCWPQLYASSSLAASNEARAAALVAEGAAAHPEPLRVQGVYAAGLGTQFLALLSKFRLVYWRTPSYNFVRLATTAAVALVYGSIYWREGRFPDPAGIGNVQNIMSVIQSSNSFLALLGMTSVMPLLGAERVVFYREQAAAMYSPWAYGAVLGLVEVPYLLAQVLLFMGIAYPMIGFAPGPACFFYYLLMILESLTFYVTFGTALVYITPSQQLAQLAGHGLNFLFNLFSGYTIPFSAMPAYCKWVNRLSPITWVLYGLGADQLAPNTGAFVYPGLPDGTTVQSYIRDLWGYEYGFRFHCLLIVGCYTVALRVVSILALRYISFLRR